MSKRVEVTVQQVEARMVLDRIGSTTNGDIAGKYVERRTATMSGGFNREGVSVHFESTDPETWEKFKLGTKFYVDLTPVA